LFYIRIHFFNIIFQDPIPAQPWTGVLDATKEGPACFQNDLLSGITAGQEDCLVLNVYTPNVMIYINRFKPNIKSL
jgi:carboxylesterase type B